ncbi:hypothetical protein [Brevibacterium casei]|uniref:Uncharacterized protein n=5 Tax=Bacteria TaxID=2 RepID=A0A2H1JN66_9MICO|nr:hypothetical protein [Brevibacterium casei]MBE4693137.1 hypothetical protein [Brevibacterium casei]MBY3576260.1 hypothetical protein [Brevibacterium casei]MCT1551698.1 hypothetical protein [Brevibacterium casei]MCT1561206.1 hypothetical protein [Brevibacterium casei]MCT2183958.1 hypothetical protein [Brevibacterium casei]
MSDHYPHGRADQWNRPNQWTGPGNVPPRNAGVPAHLRQDGPDAGWGQAGGQPPYPSAMGQSGPLGSRSAAVIAPNTPGWLARFLLWTGMVVGFLPAVLLAPILMSGDFEEVRRLHSLVTVFTGILALLLGAAAFALVRNTSWARRLIGGGLYVFAIILTLTVPPALGAFVAEISYQFNAGFWVSTVVFAVFSAFTLTLRLVGWSIARNRRWWVLLVAAGCGVIIPVINAVLQAATSTTIDRPGLPYWVGGVLVPIIALLLFLGALGLLHVLGGLRGGAAPIVAQPTLGEGRPRRSASSTALAPYPGGAPGQGPLGQGRGQDSNSHHPYGQASSGGQQPYGHVSDGGQTPYGQQSSGGGFSGPASRPQPNAGPDPYRAPDDSRQQADRRPDQAGDSQRWKPRPSDQQPGPAGQQPNSSDQQSPHRPRH